MTRDGADMTIDAGPERVVASLSGELDLSNVPDVEDALARALGPGQRELVVDLREVAFLDSTAASMLFRLAADSRDRRRALHVVAPSGTQPRRVLELLRLGDAAELVEDPPDARLPDPPPE